MKTTDQVLTGGVASKPSFGKAFLKWEPFAMLYARFALGAALLSAVAARFGIWGDNTGPDSFKHICCRLPGAGWEAATTRVQRYQDPTIR
jgi:hypothetical protein